MQYFRLVPGALILSLALTSCGGSQEDRITTETTEPSALQAPAPQPDDSAQADDDNPVDSTESVSPIVQDTGGPIVQNPDQQLFRISLGANGTELNEDTGVYQGASLTRISNDGRYVAFTSRATNAVDDLLNGQQSVFIRDTTTNEVRRITRGANGEPLNNDSSLTDMTPDGRYVVFNTSATNVLLPETGGSSQVYRHDRLTGETLLVSRNIFGEPCNNTCIGGQISNDGNFVIFRSFASNLVDNSSSGFDVIRIAIDDFSIESITAEYYPDMGAAYHQMTNDGQFVLLSFLNNNTTVLHNLDSSTANIIDNELSTGVEKRSRSISSDGRYIAYTTRSHQLIRFEVESGTSALIDADPLISAFNAPDTSPDGRYMVYTKRATADFPTAWEIYLSDLETGTTEKISTSLDGSAATATSFDPRFSRNGRYVVFSSTESNLIPDDNNFKQDAFVYRVFE